MVSILSKNKYFIISLKGIIYFILLFILLYIEPITIGPLKISQIWKTIVVFGLLMYVVKYNFPSYIWFGILFSFKFLIYSYMPDGYLYAIQGTLETLIFPIFLALFYIKYKKNIFSTEILVNIAIFFSLFLILSTIPFKLGLSSLNPEISLEKYGIEGNAVKGLFYHIASASKLFVIATLVIINTYSKFSKNNFYKVFWLVAIIIGSYFILQSWSRTSWFFYILGVFFTFFYNANLKQKMYATFGVTLFVFSLFVIYNNNEALQLRMKGGATYRTDTELSFEQLASARVPFIFIAIDNLREEGLLSQTIGYGTKRGIELFDKKTGMAIVSHNRTFEILESSGYIGLLLFIVFISKLFYRTVKKVKKNNFKYKKLTYLLMLIYTGFYLTSHGTPLWGEIILACFLIANIISSKKILIV